MAEQTENESVESSTAEPTEVATTETEQTSAETENTEAQSTEEPRIPKSRLDEVIGQRKERDEKIEQLEAQLAEKLVEKQETAPTSTKGDEPPAGLSEREIIKWYVEKDADALIQRKLGMSLETAATLLGTAKETAQDYTERRWEGLCKPHGLDPQNEDLQYYFMSATQNGKMNPEDALKRAAKIFAKGNGKTKETASVETGGVTGVMTGSKVTAKNAKDATELARKGQRVTFESQDEIIAARKARNSRATKGG